MKQERNLAKKKTKLSANLNNNKNQLFGFKAAQFIILAIFQLIICSGCNEGQKVAKLLIQNHIIMKLGLEPQESLLITMYVRMRSGGTDPLFHQFCLEFVEIASSEKYKPSAWDKNEQTNKGM